MLQNTIKTLVAVTLLVLGYQSTVNAGKDTQCKADIQILLNNYQQALNDSDASKVAPLYADDGVFMPSKKPSAIGRAQVKITYQEVFKELDLNIKFHIDEIERHGDIAFVRTTSDGKITLLEKNAIIKNNSRELFIMKRINDTWMIYRYIFNEMS
ncbi:hypothetical protein MNBD_GAMMA05-2128 [hydrothermal vent metagenome]|uniref:DUF4440 domain-containing protein n=1 Tax=hydrothermal vent metagenome TaxID=652676 RepID=A0A3B0WXZ0_9ZZZZ